MRVLLPAGAPAARPGRRRAAAPRCRRGAGPPGRRAPWYRTARLLPLALALGFARPLPAHDLWIEPTAFRPEPGQVVGARLRVGVDLEGEPLPRYGSLIEQFVYTDAAGRRPLAGRERANPAGLLRAGGPGLGVIGYHSRPSRVEVPADEFDAYLKEEGLDGILALRAAGGDAARAGTREQFQRCAKSLLMVGAPGGAQSDRTLGCPLELVVERNPYLPGAMDELPVRLTYEGRPLPGALVVALGGRRAGADTGTVERVAARSDADGRVRLRLRAGGMWLVKAVHMVPAPAATEPPADWSSYWASVTFEPEQPAAPQAR